MRPATPSRITYVNYFYDLCNDIFDFLLTFHFLAVLLVRRY